MGRWHSFSAPSVIGLIDYRFLKARACSIPRFFNYTHGLSQEGQFVQEGIQVVDFIDNVEYVPDVNTN